MTKINQEDYGNIEIDTREKDIVQIWGYQLYSTNVVQIERKNLLKVIKVLQAQLKKKK